jgi:hypothetical protein
MKERYETVSFISQNHRVKENIQSEGYYMFRNFFQSGEIQELREKIIAAYNVRQESGTAQNDSLSNPTLAPYLYDERILDVARSILDTDRPIYFGDSNYAVVGHEYQPKRDAIGWHRDNTDRSNTSLPDWDGNYGLIRFGIYPQNHRFTSGGLMVRRTTHNRIVRGYKAHFLDRYLNNGMNDLSVWNMRIQHSGLGRCIRGLPWLAVGPSWQEKLPQWVQAPFAKKTRIGFWMSYGREGEHLDRHCDYLMGRAERKTMWQDSFYSADTLAACDAAGLTVRNMPEAMREALLAGEAVGHHQHHYQYQA